MTRLSCTARNCVNNEGGLCGAENILVKGVEASSSQETFCSSFKEETVVSQIAAIGNTNYVGEVMQMLSDMSDIKMSPNVHCYATRCFYNGNGICEARDMMIIGDGAKDSRDTLCQTFIE